MRVWATLSAKETTSRQAGGMYRHGSLSLSRRSIMPQNLWHGECGILR
jgi:hypothetical protein